MKVNSNAGLPDGLTLDAEGFVWSAEWYGSRISSHASDGTFERQISVPAKQCSSLIFGGPELQDIFVTSAGKSEPMPVMPCGYDPDTGGHHQITSQSQTEELTLSGKKSFY
jgi:sugar lactone lactonase YvrE